ncbi:MAG: Vitamin B12 import ATP-binding protein BtuD [Mycoplasmataceae bacterium]|nr:MAG: Vitamin B12 import ATP-binding protein BtuD [Mycoplasmataceae bacterium]
MVRLFLDRKKVKNIEELRDNKFKLLTYFFLNILRNNKFLFFITFILAFSSALVNYNIGIIIRNAFYLPSDNLSDKLNDFNKKIDSDNEFKDEKDEEGNFDKEKIKERIIKEIKDGRYLSIIEAIDLNNGELSKESLKKIINENSIDKTKLHEKKLKITFNVLFTMLFENVYLEWKQFIFVLIALLIFVKAPISLLHWYVNSYCCSKIEKDLKLELFKILVGSNYENSSEIAGKMITQFTADLDNISVNIWSIPNRLIYVFTSIFLNIYFDFSFGGKMNFNFIGIALLLFSSLFFFVFLLLKQAVKLGIDAKRRYEEDNRIIFERINNLEYIKSNSSEIFEQFKVYETLDKTFQNNKESLLWTALFKSLPNYLLIPNIPFLFMAIITLIHDIEKENSPEFIFVNFIRYYYTINRLNSEISKILESIVVLEDLSSEFYIVNESVLKLDSERVILRKDETDNFEKGDIHFKNIFFNYPSRPENMIIEDLSFTFNYGEKYGIAGKNGIGKSTITKIILKLYEISNGKVFIGKKDLSKIKTEILHENICHLTNHPTFFNMSIAENILYPLVYREELHLKKLINAAKKVKIFNFIKTLSNGFDTVLRQGGYDLSEGQKQQFEAMKVFMKDYEIFIFDEILSNVHPVTRKSILNNIFERVNGKTVITIDHHYDIFKHMDHVYNFSSKKLSKVTSLKKIEKDND